jgi:hypothetical protein
MVNQHVKQLHKKAEEQWARSHLCAQKVFAGDKDLSTPAFFVYTCTPMGVAELTVDPRLAQNPTFMQQARQLAAAATAIARPDMAATQLGAVGLSSFTVEDVPGMADLESHRTPKGIPGGAAMTVCLKLILPWMAWPDDPRLPGGSMFLNPIFEMNINVCMWCAAKGGCPLGKFHTHGL